MPSCIVFMNLKECLESKQRLDILDRWDYDLNKVSPENVSVTDKKKYYFKCPRGIHESELRNVNIFHNNKFKNLECKKCKSFAQVIIDRHGKKYLESIWGKNDFSPWDYGAESKREAEFKCTKGHIYIRPLVTKGKLDYGCPYCSNRAKKIDLNQSVGKIFPEIFNVWSDKNKKTPYEYSIQSGQKAWFKCENNEHKDYCRTIASSVKKDFKCPKCVMEYLNTHRPSGDESPAWKGGLTSPNKLQRTSLDYKNWRKSVFERDNYTCQCCFTRGGRLNAHHIQNYADNESLRFDVDNGITLCEKCHCVNISGSFHNIYGAWHNTPEQLYEYIENKRNELGVH